MRRWLAWLRRASFSVVRTFSAREPAGCLLVLITLAPHVSQPAVQVSDLLTERGLAGGNAVLRLDHRVEAVFQVGVLVGEHVPPDICLGGQGHDRELAVRAQRRASQEAVHCGLDPGRSSLVIGGLAGDTGAGVAGGDLLQAVGALGEPVPQRSGGQRAGDLGAQVAVLDGQSDPAAGRSR
jgi:hypothetical protein